MCVVSWVSKDFSVLSFHGSLFKFLCVVLCCMAFVFLYFILFILVVDTLLLPVDPAWLCVMFVVGFICAVDLLCVPCF